MSSLLDIEEGEASEITLSTASLLGIFFGLVLICGVFFGFGYSMGRGAAERGVQASGTASAPATNSTDTDETTTGENAKSPAPASLEQDGTPAPATAALPSAVARPGSDGAATNAPASDAPVPALRSAADSSPAHAPATSATASGSGGLMVQIAAVAHQEDADVLVSALRQRGYGVVVRSEPQDKLLHVQVGPFADRAAATTIKQKLLSDGYNAIIKQ